MHPFAAEIVDYGPYKGWPIAGAVAIEEGMSPADVRAALVEAIAAEHAAIDERIAAVRALPDPPKGDTAVRVQSVVYASSEAFSAAAAFQARQSRDPQPQAR